MALRAATALWFARAAAAAIRGVAPDEQAKYQGAVFSCGDGFAEVPSASINDNFCDCADGSDEPGTGACAGQDNTLFYCPNIGSTPKRVYASRVNDGICDCCDGSDECVNGNCVKCADTCKEQGARERAEREEKTAALKAGLAKKASVQAQALKDREEWQNEMTQLESELPALEQAAEELKKAREAKEAAEKAAKDDHKALEEAADAKNVNPACMWRQTGGCLATGDREPANDKSCTLPITEGASGFCDCDGDGVFGGTEHGFDCGKAPAHCKLLCPKDQVSVYWVDTEGDSSTIAIEDGKMHWYVATENSQDVQKIEITKKDGKFAVLGPFGASTIVEPATNEGQTELLKDLVRMALSVNVRVTGYEGSKIKLAVSKEDVEEAAAGEAAEGGEEKKVVSEYAKWMEDAETQMTEEEGKDGKKPKVSEYSKWMEGAEEAGAGKDDDAEDEDDEDDEEDSDDEEDYVLNSGQPAKAGVEKDEEDAANDKLGKNNDRRSELSKKMNAMNEEHLGYASLMGQRLEKKIGEFSYKITFFDKADQDHTSLGTWSQWTGPKSGEFTDGSSCWQGPARKLMVDFQCGVDAEILDVSEPSRCVYAGVVTHPGACVESDLELLARPPVAGPHDKLEL